jgi:thymidylate synthase (FAD)
MTNFPQDPLFTTKVLAQTPEPQKLCWLAMHQDYSSAPVYNSKTKEDEESSYGRLVVDRCLKFGHWGVVEHPQITVNVCNFPHSVMSQARTHRVGTSFDVQSFRFTGEHLMSVKTIADVEAAVYFRQPGFYSDRFGHKVKFTADMRNRHLDAALEAIINYQQAVLAGEPYEMARGLLPHDYRQHFVFSANARSLMHFLDVRYKADAQGEIQCLAEQLMSAFKAWMPEIAAYYENTRLSKSKLSP